MQKYKAIERENKEYKYYKDIPYIRKRDFDERNYKFVGETKLKETNKEDDYEAVIKQEDNEYIIKDSCFGIEKGYIQIEENSYIILKRVYPIIIWFFLGVLLLGILLGTIISINEKKVDLVSPVVEQIKEPEPNKEEKKVIYKISFNGNGASGEMDSIDVLEKETFHLPKNQFKRRGYQFIGWALKPFGQVVYLDQSEIENLQSDEKEIILYAVFSINQYKVIFLDYNGNILHEQFQNYNSNVEMPTNPTREGYTFVGWDNNINKIVAETTYKALYDVNNYNITYTLNGGTLSNNNPSSYTIESANILINNPSKRGYTFTGWSINNSSNIYKNYILTTGNYGDKHLDAKYSPNKYKIIFDSNEGENFVDEKEVYFDSEYGELPEPTREGYTFTGWVNQEKELVDENTIYDEVENITLTATWEANNYEVVLNPNEGEVNPEKIIVTYDSEYGELPEPTREGYNFKGWYLNDEEIKNNTIVKTSSNHELVAKWKEINYVIEYNTVGGILEATVTIYNVENEDFDLPQPTKEGYTFTGWTGDNGTTPQKIVTIKSGTVGNYKYQANWQINYYTVYYFVNNVLWTTRSVPYQGTIPNLEYPINDKQVFSGWRCKSVMGAEDLRIYGDVRETNCGVRTGHGSLDRVSAFVSVFNSAGFNARLTDSNGAYAVVSDPIYAYSTAVNMLNYVWANTSPSGAHALNYIELSCDNGNSFAQRRS